MIKLADGTWSVEVGDRVFLRLSPQKAGGPLTHSCIQATVAQVGDEAIRLDRPVGVVMGRAQSGLPPIIGREPTEADISIPIADTDAVITTRTKDPAELATALLTLVGPDGVSEYLSIRECHVEYSTTHRGFVSYIADRG